MTFSFSKLRFKNQYSSFPALWFFLLYAAGISCAWYFIEVLNFDCLLIAGVVLFCFAVLTHLLLKRIFILFVIPLVFLLGALNLKQSLSAFDESHLLFHEVREYSFFRGWISEIHYRKDGKHRYILETTQVLDDSSVYPACGKVMIRQTMEDYRFAYGEVIQFFGKPELPSLSGNPGELNYRRYLQLNEVYFQYDLTSPENFTLLPEKKGSFWKAKFLEPIRLRILRVIDDHVSSPTADVIKALLLGERQDIDRSIIENFQKTGIIHILAISGLHVGFVLLIFLMIFSLLPLSYKVRIFLTLLCLFIFVALVNFKAPVVRAALMAALYFLSKMLERPGSSLNVIAVAALIILFVAPQQLLQPGFQFSFAAVAAILYGYPQLGKLQPLNVRFYGSHLFYRWLIQPFWISTAAVLGTTPLTWWYYGTFQLGAFIINIIIIPLIGLFLMLSILLIFLGALKITLAAGLATLLHYFFMFILQIVNFFSDLPLVQLQLAKPSLILIILSILAIILFFRLNGLRRFIYPLIILILIVVIDLIPPTQGDELQVTFVNVGQGDASIIKFPNNAVMVIDGGDKNEYQDAGERYLLPLLNHYRIKRIKYLVGSHVHSDHIGGFAALLANVQVDTLVLPDYTDESLLYQTMIQIARGKNVPLLYKTRGQQLYPDPSCRAFILHPYGPYLQKTDQNNKEVNNTSLVIKVVFGETSFLFNGDLESDAEEALYNYDSFLRSNVMKVGHHGSKSSTSPGFLNLIRPQISVVSVGRFNNFFHPSSQTLQLLKDYQAHPLRTDHFGALVFSSDGKELHLVNWRQ